MNNKLINKIKSSIAVLKKSKKMDFNCPYHSHKVVELFLEIKDHLTRKIVLKSEIKEILGVYKLVTKDTHFSTEEIKKNLDAFQAEFTKKKEESLISGKKMLVIMGESHEFQESMFFEILISTILKANGFNSALVEYNKDGFEKLLSNSYKLMNGMSVEFFKKILDMKVAAIDPLHDENTEDYLNIPRCNAINKAIAENSQQDQIAVVGALHLKHIIGSKEINDNFIVMPLRVDFASEKAPNELADQFPENILSDEILTLRFNDSIESFSINKLLEIYINTLPMALGSEVFSENSIYHSDFSSNFVQCKKFDYMPQLVEYIDLNFRGMINSNIEEL